MQEDKLSGGFVRGRRRRLARAATALVLTMSTIVFGAAYKVASDTKAYRDFVESEPFEVLYEPPFSPMISAEPDLHEQTRRRCESKLRAVLSEPALPGAPRLMEKRLEILARVKSEPAFFVREPRHSDEPVSPYASALRKRMSSGHPFTMLKRLRSHFLNFHADARATVLKEGYLYADTPEGALAIMTLLKARHLFGHDRIWIQRGARLLYAVRDETGRYHYENGEDTGKRVRLMVFDRLGSGSPPTDALHRDLRGLRYRLHFRQMQIRTITENNIVANLRYGKWWVPTLLASDGPRLELDCEIASRSIQAAVTNFRQDERRRERSFQVVRRVILEEIDERLPFDEPRHEYGHQLDGKLRVAWRSAYQRGKKRYNFNGDPYLVFDLQGRPFVPQVCIDFLTDTLERASGTWWRDRTRPPARDVGRLDFSAYENPDLLRQVPRFTALAREHPEMFEIYEPPWRVRVKIGLLRLFIDYLIAETDQYIPGDIVLIKGKTPWDRRRAHYHSFFIYESDPLTGVPLYIAGNAGRPTLRAWETESRRTPLRYIVTRIRPRTDWLESIVRPNSSTELEPPSLGPGRG
ncbi:MAG: hypothetical protein HRU17_14725 [Polyangiaceae bacterium]|nr:hypothetical protein [Polyangiaceae bacterium]